MQKDKIISNVLAGVLVAVMNVTVAISVAALIFTNTSPDFLAPGIVVLLLGTLITGLGATLFSDFKGVISGPRSGLAPVFAAIVSGIFVFMEGEPTADTLATAIMALMVTAVVSGAFLIFLGKLRLGGLVRYIPYPVMGGFFAGIGFIFVEGGLTVAMGQSPGLAVFNDLHLLQLSLPAVAFALLLYIVPRFVDHWSTFPATLCLALAVFYTVFFQVGANFVDASSAGWLPPTRRSPIKSVVTVSLWAWSTPPASCWPCLPEPTLSVGFPRSFSADC
ncbi:MAG: SulP family inorganic anion transporter [Pseudohongiellaceae bacterium]